MLRKRKEVPLLYSNYADTMPRVPMAFSQGSQMSSYGSTSEATTAHGTDPCNESRRLWLNALLREGMPFSSDTTWGRYVPRIAAGAILT